MKNKYIYLFLSLILIFALTGCGQKKETSQKTETGKEESFSGSLKDLLARGKNLKCNLTYNSDSGAKTHALTYVSGKKFKQEIKLENSGMVNEQNLTFYTLSDGEWLYTWNFSKPNKGTKSKLADLEAEAKKAGNTGNVDWEKKFDYQCQTWLNIGNELDVPQDVNFQEAKGMGAVVQPQAGGSPAPSVDICSLCDKAPTQEARDECKKSSGCNN